MLLLTKPALNYLGIPSKVLGTFGSAIFDTSSHDILTFRNLDANSAHTFTYHIALGFFSLAFRYSPESKTYIDILRPELQGRCCRNPQRPEHASNHYRTTPPSSLARSASYDQARHILAHSTQRGYYRRTSTNRYHYMISLRKSSEFVDYTRLSAKMRGTAVNIATNELCWQAPAEHAGHMVEGLRERVIVLLKFQDPN